MLSAQAPKGLVEQHEHPHRRLGHDRGRSPFREEESDLAAQVPWPQCRDDRAVLLDLDSGRPSRIANSSYA
jgi:hypothetical protein